MDDQRVLSMFIGCSQTILRAAGRADLGQDVWENLIRIDVRGYNELVTDRKRWKRLVLKVKAYVMLQCRKRRKRRRDIVDHMRLTERTKDEKELRIKDINRTANCACMDIFKIAIGNFEVGK